MRGLSILPSSGCLELLHKCLEVKTVEKCLVRWGVNILLAPTLIALFLTIGLDCLELFINRADTSCVELSIQLYCQHFGWHELS